MRKIKGLFAVSSILWGVFALLPLLHAAPTPEEAQKITRAQILSADINQQNWDFDKDGNLELRDTRLAKEGVKEALTVQALLDVVTFATLDQNDDGILDDADVAGIFLLYQVGYIDFSIGFAQQKITELETQKQETETRLVIDRQTIPPTINWSLAILREIVRILNQIQLAGAGAMSQRIADYLLKARTKLDPLHPLGIAQLFPGVLDEYVNSQINFYQSKIDFWQTWTAALNTYKTQLLAATSLAEMETLDQNFPTRGPVPHLDRLTTMIPLGLWNLWDFKEGLIDQGRSLIIEALSTRSLKEAAELIQAPTIPTSPPRLGIYWSLAFNNVFSPFSEKRNFQTAAELATYGVQYVDQILIPLDSEITSERKDRVLNLLLRLTQYNIITDIGPVIIDDSIWPGYPAWKSLLAPQFAQLSFLDGLVGLYLGHEVMKEFLNHQIRTAIRQDVRDQGFSRSLSRFYYGSVEALFRPLRNTGTWRANTALGKWQESAVFGDEGDIINVGLNKGDGSTFLNPIDRYEALVDAMLFNAYTKEVFPANIKRYVHINVPVLEESSATPTDLQQLITESLVAIVTAMHPDVLMLRVTSIGSGGLPQDVLQVAPVTGEKIYLEAIKQAQLLLGRTPLVFSNQWPRVNAGQDQTVPFQKPFTLEAVASDDGNPIPPGQLTFRWEKISGPGTVSFLAPTALNTTVSFSAMGVYVLGFDADDGEFISHDEIQITVTENTSNASLPTYKNVFNPRRGEKAEIGFTVDEAGSVTITLYNRIGEQIRVLLHDDRPAGIYVESWDGRNSQGSWVASGVYQALIKTESKTQIQKVILVK